MMQKSISVGYSHVTRSIKACAALIAVTISLFAAPALADDLPAPLIMAFGDSLTAGYGVGPGASFPDQLQDALRAGAFPNVKVHNAGVSGDTSAGGRSRLAWNLAGLGATPDLLILELGANDALRGIAPERTRKNIHAILEQLQKRGIRVLMTGMLAPPNMGDEYGAEFNAIFPELAAEFGVAFYPFFLEGVVADAALNQDDGIHPTKEGVAIIVENIMPAVLKALDASEQSATAGQAALAQ